MATSTCKVSSLLHVCKIFERILPSGNHAARLHCLSTGLHPHGSGALTAVQNLPFNRLCVPVVPLVTTYRHSWYIDKRVSGNLGAVGVTDIDPDVTVLTDKEEGKDLANMINTNLESRKHGRLFAVVRIAGAQRKITAEDIIVVDRVFPPSVGDRLRLEKVLLVGGRDFTLLGQPILSRDQVKVEATVIEKTLTSYRVWSTYRKRTRFRKLKVFRVPQTMLVINSIELTKLSKETQEIKTDTQQAIAE